MFKYFYIPALLIALSLTFICLICSKIGLFSDFIEIYLVVIIMIYMFAIIVGLLNYYYHKLENLIKNKQK